MFTGHSTKLTVGGRTITSKELLDVMLGVSSYLEGVQSVMGMLLKEVKAGKPLIDFITLGYTAKKPLLLIGKHGLGKSEILEQTAAELGIGYICRDLSLMEPPDLIGLPKMDTKTTKYLPPDFLPTEGKGLLVFEELNRCPSYMRAPCLQLLTARTLNDYKLPPGWLPVAAINPPDSNYEVQELDPALMSRFIKAVVIADRGEWLKWATQNDIDERVINYVKSDSQIFKDVSPRDLSMVSAVLKAAASTKKFDVKTVDVALAGVFGRERMVAFNAFCKGGMATVLTAEGVLLNYEEYRETIASLTTAGKTDTLENLVYDVKVWLQSEDNFIKLRRQSHAWKEFGQFIDDLPADQGRAIVNFLNASSRAVPICKRSTVTATIKEKLKEKK